MLWASTICELLAEAVHEFDLHEKDMGIIRSQIVQGLQKQLYSLVDRNDALLSSKRTVRLRGVITSLGVGIGVHIGSAPPFDSVFRWKRGKL